MSLAVQQGLGSNPHQPRIPRFCTARSHELARLLLFGMCDRYFIRL